MAKLPEHPRCPYCGSCDTERHWGDELMQAGLGVLGALADMRYLGGIASDETLSKGAETVVDAFSQKYTCNDCGNNFTLEQSENSENNDFDSDYSEDGSFDNSMSEIDRTEIIEHSAFEMEIEDVFEIEGRGIVITGRISTGYVCVGETINISGATGPEYEAEVTGVEMFRKLLDRGEEGDNVGLLVKGVNKSDIEPGMVASHILHIKTKSASSDDQPTPKGQFMKGLLHQANRYGCKIPSLPDDVVIKLAEKYGVDIRDGFRIAQKFDAIERLEAKVNPNNSSDLELKNEDTTEKEQEYIAEYRECLADGDISASEVRLLNKLAKSLGISEERARELEKSVTASNLTDAEKQYLDEYKACLEDAPVLSSSTRRLLNRLATSLNLSDEQVSKLEKM